MCRDICLFTDHLHIVGSMDWCHRITIGLGKGLAGKKELERTMGLVASRDNTCDLGMADFMRHFDVSWTCGGRRCSIRMGLFQICI